VGIILAQTGGGSVNALHVRTTSNQENQAKARRSWHGKGSHFS
jgi:hypothetical protein